MAMGAPYLGVINGWSGLRASDLPEMAWGVGRGVGGVARFEDPHDPRLRELYGFVLDELGVEVLVGYRDAQHVEGKRVLRLMGEAHLPCRPHHPPEGSGSRGRELLRATQEALKLDGSSLPP
jgi:hypothetical protein